MLMNYDFSFSPVNLSSVNIITSAIELKRGRGNPLPPVFMVSYIYQCFFFFLLINLCVIHGKLMLDLKSLHICNQKH